MDIFNYKRRKSSTVAIGNTPLGGEYPIRIQTMTDTSTRDIEGSIAQILKVTDAGADYVRLTTQGILEVDALKAIRSALRKKNNNIPLIADIHFNPKVAYAAATVTEKIRINPGNFTDNARVFKHIEYTDESYSQELMRLRSGFIELLDICKEHKTSLRIGVNHGSLSDRIMSRYGDTPDGIVESCMEFLRICKEQNFKNTVVSIKASNTAIMVKSVRLLVSAMDKEDIHYPLHLGVTEAGEGEDGRIKSAVGIGALLCDGIGDTIRVSLSEPPEDEVPVAKQLAEYITDRASHNKILAEPFSGYNYLTMERHICNAVKNIGGTNPPIVISDASEESNTPIADTKADYIYLGKKDNVFIDGNTPKIIDIDSFDGRDGYYPLFYLSDLKRVSECRAEIKFLKIIGEELNEKGAKEISSLKNCVLIIDTINKNSIGEWRAAIHRLISAGYHNPIILTKSYTENKKESLQIKSGADFGTLFLDGFGDGIEISNNGTVTTDEIIATSFSILQAVRLRTSKTEYISCPGCGRTQFDLQKRVAEIKKATPHLVGLKIGIMGCIVNGPGEMADADYGYVGAARGKISLYKGKTCIEKNIPEEEAVKRLLLFIESDVNKKIK